MREAASISTEGTAPGRARADAAAPALAADATRAAVWRAGIDPSRIERLALHRGDRLGIDPGGPRVDGGAIATGHPFGSTGSRLFDLAPIEGRRRGARPVVVSMPAAARRGTAGPFEIA